MFKIGDRVYYIDNGPADTGTVACVQTSTTKRFGVDWDHSDEDDIYLESQLAYC